MKFYLPLSLILSSLLFGACSAEPDGNSTSSNSPSNVNSNSSKKANDNLEELGMLIKVPYEPEDVLWLEEPGRKLTVVLLYLPADVQKVVADAEKHGAATNVSLEPADWFPKELISQHDLSGEPLQGKQYPANEFFQAPYNSGRLVRIDGTDYFVVELTAN
jgi:hypothetical protein